MNLDDLKKPFDPSKISWRVGATNKDKTSAIALAYIDARDVMERLDEVCGPQGWQALYPHANGKTSCKIGILLPVNEAGDKEWVWKENGAGDSDVEAEKGAFSDAFKRAAVLWGIGRYLYDVENIRVDIVPYGKSYKIKNPNDPKLAKALEKAAKGIRPSPEVITEPTGGKSRANELVTLAYLCADDTELNTFIDQFNAEIEAMEDMFKETVNQAIEYRAAQIKNGVTPLVKHNFASVLDQREWVAKMLPVVKGFKSTKSLSDWRAFNTAFIMGLSDKGANNKPAPRAFFLEILDAKANELSNLELSQTPLAAE